MTLQHYMQVMRPAVEDELQRSITDALPAEYPELRAMLAYHMGWEGEGAGIEAQGKRIRPLLVLLCCAAAGSSSGAVGATEDCDWKAALPAAAAVELLHNFSLIHDDIQDNSPLRRGRSTVWVKWGPAQAINAGDVMFTLSFLAVQGLAASLPPQSVLLASRILQETCLRLTQGQYLDISYESANSLPIEAYWPMIGGKTSALLACCAELGALSAGAGTEQRQFFHDYGYNLGLAFQVLDDWLGIWGEAEQTGKSVESDLVSGKKTLPVLYALSKAGPFSERWLQGKVTPEEVPVLSRMLEDEGACAFTLETAEQFTEKSLQALRQAAGQENPAAQALEELTHALLKRKN
jgi:geranylgeranyl diphosphate synthase, type I